MNRDWDMIEGGGGGAGPFGGTDFIHPEQWIEDSILIGSEYGL